MNYIPNIISGLRLLFIPIFVFFFANEFYMISLYIFFIMGISDALDGMIARHLKSESSLGAYLDAIADKIMIIVSFFMSVEIEFFLSSLFNVLPTLFLFLLSFLSIFHISTGSFGTATVENKKKKYYKFFI